MFAKRNAQFFANIASLLYPKTKNGRLESSEEEDPVTGETNFRFRFEFEVSWFMRRLFAYLGLFYEADSEQENHCADGCGNDRSEPLATDRNVEHFEQPSSDDRSENPDDNVAQQAEAAALQDLSGQPAGDRSDDQKNECLL